MLDELESIVENELAKLQLISASSKENKNKSPLKTLPSQTVAQSMENCSFRPMLSKNSLKIAAQLGDARERLTRPRTMTQELPKTKSKSKSRSITPTAPRWEQLYTLNQFYKTKKEALRAQIEMERSKENEATFQPDLRKSQLNYGEFTMAFEQRNRYWEAKKQEKLQEQQKEQLNETQSLCTFKPRMQKKVAMGEVKVSEFNKKGLITYFERVQQAQKLKEQPIPKKVKHSRITQTVEFKFQRF